MTRGIGEADWRTWPFPHIFAADPRPFMSGAHAKYLGLHGSGAWKKGLDRGGAQEESHGTPGGGRNHAMTTPKAASIRRENDCHFEYFTWNQGWNLCYYIQWMNPEPPLRMLKAPGNILIQMLATICLSKHTLLVIYWIYLQHPQANGITPSAQGFNLLEGKFWGKSCNVAGRKAPDDKWAIYYLLGTLAGQDRSVDEAANLLWQMAKTIMPFLCPAEHSDGKMDFHSVFAQWIHNRTKRLIRTNAPESHGMMIHVIEQWSNIRKIEKQLWRW